MPRKSDATPEHINRRVRQFVAVSAKNNALDPAAIKKLCSVIGSTKPEIKKIWVAVDRQYLAMYANSRKHLDMKVFYAAGDGQQWLCRAIIASIPESRHSATTRKIAMKWQTSTRKKLQELDGLFAVLPASCARLPNLYADKVIAHMQADELWRGRDELLVSDRALRSFRKNPNLLKLLQEAMSDPARIPADCKELLDRSRAMSATRSLLYRYRILLQLLQAAVSDPALIPDDFDFKVRPNSRTIERNHFMRELSQAFADELGKPKISWVAEITAAIYGGEPDMKEVRRQIR